MSESVVRVIENSYFALKQARREPTGVTYWDAMRKAPLLAGAVPELLEVLARVLGEGEENLVLIPMRDYALFQDLQLVGCPWTGYAVLTPDGASDTWDLWESPGHLQIIPTSGIEAALGADPGRVVRMVVSISPQLGHDPRSGVRDYLEFVRSRERYFSGLSTTDYLRSKSLWQPETEPGASVKSAAKTRKAAKRAPPRFSDVISRRLSAENLGGDATLTRSELETIFEDAYYQRADGHFPVATAGGLGTFRIWVVSEGSDGFAAGCYSVDARTRAWSKTSSGPVVDDLFQAAFAQEAFKGCQTWLAIEADLQPLSEKYGARAYRFGLMGAGALVQTIHLSCTSLGVRFRAAGGFDDGMVEHLLKLPGNGFRRVLVLAGLAK